MPVQREEDTNTPPVISDSDSSEEDSLEEDTVDILALHGDLDPEEVVRKYGTLRRAQRQVVDDPAASVYSIVKAYTIKTESIGTGRNQDSVWDIFEKRCFADALTYEGLSENTRDALLAAPIVFRMNQAQMDTYAKKCHDCWTTLRRGFSGLSDEDTMSIRQKFNLDLEDDKTAENTLKLQFRRYEAAAEGEKARTRISKRGKELYALKAFSETVKEIFDLATKLGVSLPSEPPFSTLIRLPVRTKPHAKDSWKMISDAHSSVLPALLKDERLAFEQDNRMKVFADWPTWRERGSRADWAAKQIISGNLKDMACWKFKESADHS